jgi:hypothetical protein
VLSTYGRTVGFKTNRPDTVIIAGFTDSNAGAFPGQFTVTINWGDNTTSSGGLVTIAGTGFDVIGKHTYTTAGTYAITATIDDMLTGETYNVVSSGSVVQGKISVQVHNLYVSAGKVFQGIVATFTDSGPNAPPSAYKATISWGNGQKSVGTITGQGGRFVITGKHLFRRFAASKPVVVTISGTGNRAVTAREFAYIS